MSWSLQRVMLATEPNVALTDDEIASIEGMNAGSTDPARVALTIAQDLIRSGAFGGEDKRFNVMLSGHVNPNHEPVAGWSNDCVTVNVVQRTEPSA